jgi:hypothetical protein
MGSSADLTETGLGRFPSPSEITLTGETPVDAPGPQHLDHLSNAATIKALEAVELPALSV